MNSKALTVLIVGVCLVTSTLPDLVDARSGGRGGGGSGFSGGGGFSRGGGGFSSSDRGSFGSIRNSERPSTRESASPSDRLSGRDQGDIERGKLSDAQREGVRDRASNLTPDQKQQIKDRAANLTPEEKALIRQKFENSGLKPSQLPAETPARDPDQIREDWQDWRNQNREDWQNWYQDMYDDYWDDHWHDAWWYGYPVSSVSYTFYVDDSLPCQEQIVVVQPSGKTTYYHCNSVWYQPVYASGNIKYVVASAPTGVEMPTLLDSYEVRMDGQSYYLSNHVFYQKTLRDGQVVYVSIEAPLGARVPTIPPYAVIIKHQDQTYYRIDKVFYQRKGEFFVVVANPGV